MQVDQNDEVQRLRRELRAAFTDRARLVYRFYKEVSLEIGANRAVEVLRRAAYDLGREVAPTLLEPYGGQMPTPSEAVENYQKNGPDQGRIYPIRFTCNDDGSCDVDTLGCPIKDLMEQLQVAQNEFEDVVTIFDGGTEGMLQGMGFKTKTQLPKLGDDICCRIHITAADA